MVNPLHLYSTFLTSGHSLPNIHSSQGEASCSGTPRHPEIVLAAFWFPANPLYLLSLMLPPTCPPVDAGRGVRGAVGGAHPSGIWDIPRGPGPKQPLIHSKSLDATGNWSPRQMNNHALLQTYRLTWFLIGLIRSPLHSGSRSVWWAWRCKLNAVHQPPCQRLSSDSPQSPCKVLWVPWKPLHISLQSQTDFLMLLQIDTMCCQAESIYCIIMGVCDKT